MNTADAIQRPADASPPVSRRCEIHRVAKRSADPSGGIDPQVPIDQGHEDDESDAAVSNDAQPWALTDQQISCAVNNIAKMSASPNLELALFYLLLTTGLWPLEVGRLKVRHAIAADGRLLERCDIDADVTITGVGRTVYYRTTSANEALEAYLGERVRRKHGIGSDSRRYRGLDPDSSLLLDRRGAPFEIRRCGPENSNRWLCRGLHVLTRSVLRRAGVPGLSVRVFRRTLAQRLVVRGATVGQVGLAMGMRKQQAVRNLLKRRPVELPAIFSDLVP